MSKERGLRTLYSEVKMRNGDKTSPLNRTVLEWLENKNPSSKNATEELVHSGKSYNQENVGEEVKDVGLLRCKRISLG